MAPGGHYVETSSSKRIGGKPQNSEDYPKTKVAEIESNKPIGKSPDAYTAAAKAEVTKAEKKEHIVVVRMQIED